MSLQHASLPSFAQTFAASSSAVVTPERSISPGNLVSLPPIQSSLSADHTSTVAGRKRARTQASSSSREYEQRRKSRSPSRSHSPLPTIKTEPASADVSTTDTAPPSSPPAHKKRRVTVSGPSLNTNVPRASGRPSAGTPISPALAGFTIQRDDPGAVEAVRNSMNVMQKQQKIIEERRSTNNEDRERSSVSRQPPPPRRRSPTQARISSPPPHPSLSSSSNALPPLAPSFARRRAEQLTQRKPADILISPREAHTPEQFAPTIQSAPPVPRPGAGGTGGGFGFGGMMTLPRLPSVLKENGAERRAVPGKVPPTPTRLAAAAAQGGRPLPSIAQHHHHHQPHHSHPHPHPSAGGRSPPAPTIPIASTLMPPTPSSLHHPGYTGDKGAFLAPFEMFYDALNDSKKLKGWLGEQLSRSSTLLAQQENMAEHIESIVEKRMGGMRKEIAGLNRRVEELEEALRTRDHSSAAPASSSAFRRPSIDYHRDYAPLPPPPMYVKPGGKPAPPPPPPQKNGSGAPADSYQFPLPPTSSNASAMRRSPMWERENPIDPAPAASSSSRLSSSRLDPPRQQQQQSPPKRERSSSRASAAAIPLLRQHSNSSPRMREREPPPPARSSSTAPPSTSTSSRQRERGDSVMAPPQSTGRGD